MAKSTHNQSQPKFGITKERYPESYLPQKGKIRLKRNGEDNRGVAFIYKDCPTCDKTRTQTKIKVGRVIFEDKGELRWRDYEDVRFVNNMHYMKIKLSPWEADKSEVGHGWCVFEDKLLAIQRKYRFLEGKETHESQFLLYRKPTVLISLFDGIGGARVAIDRIKDRFNVFLTFVSETDDLAREIVERHWGSGIVNLGDIENISKATIRDKIFDDKILKKHRSIDVGDDEIQYIIIAGPPCQDLSQANENKEGVLGKKSRLFFHVPRIIQYITDILKNKGKTVHFIVENVEMDKFDQDIFTEFLGLIDHKKIVPCKIDFGAACCSLMKRRRMYWCSFLCEDQDYNFEDFKSENCVYLGKLKNDPLSAVLYEHGYPGFEYVNKKTNAIVNELPTMTRHIDSVGQEAYFIREEDTYDQTFIPGPESVNEELLGFPRGYTDCNDINTKIKLNEDRKMRSVEVTLDEYARRELLGNSFMVFHIQFLLTKMHSQLIQTTYEKKIIEIKPPIAHCQRLMIDEKTPIPLIRFCQKLEELLRKKFNSLDKRREITDIFKRVV